MIYSKYVKRLLDIIFSLLFIILFAWVYVLIGILVAIKLGTPVLFTQERPGRIDKKTGKERIFKLYKFRSMINAKDLYGNLLPDEKRLTSFGKMLRASSLDELPEMFNILKGDMSFVGPRPLLVRYLPRYSDKQHHRHDVRPGLTGLAQSKGRNAVSWEERFKYDLEYVNNISFILDCKILIDTVKIVFHRTGVTSNTSVTMEEFVGSEK